MMFRNNRANGYWSFVEIGGGEDEDEDEEGKKASSVGIL